MLLMPSEASDDTLRSCAQFRCKRRLPALVYKVFIFFDQFLYLQC
jgi:hypothetical protein